jgi:hypothetical protein
MSKGKHAASQNAKKLALAEQRIVELEREQTLLISAAHSREQELLTQIQALENRFVAKVDLLAADQVNAAKREAEKRVEKAQQMHTESVLAAFRYMHANGELRLTLKDWGEVAAILKVNIGQVVASVVERNNRNARRTNHSHLNGVAESIKSSNTGLMRRAR